MTKQLPKWGNYVYFADHDLLSFALLEIAGLTLPAMYHATQALEKYLGALAICVRELNDLPETENFRGMIRSHRLIRMAEYCSKSYLYYKSFIPDPLRRFEEFDQATRYPETMIAYMRKHPGPCFTEEDIQTFENVAKRLRNDIQIVKDDYPLGLALRQHCHSNPEAPLDPIFHRDRLLAVRALKHVFNDPDALVRR